MKKLIVVLMLTCLILSGCAEKGDKEPQGYVPGINWAEYMSESPEKVKEVLDEKGIEYEIQKDRVTPYNVMKTSRIFHLLYIWISVWMESSF